MKQQKQEKIHRSKSDFTDPGKKGKKDAFNILPDNKYNFVKREACTRVKSKTPLLAKEGCPKGGVVLSFADRATNPTIPPRIAT